MYRVVFLVLMLEDGLGTVYIVVCTVLQCLSNAYG